MIRLTCILLFFHLAASAQNYSLDDLRTIRNEKVKFNPNKTNIVVTTTNKICHNCLIQLDNQISIDTSRQALYLVMITNEYNVLGVKRFKHLVNNVFVKNKDHLEVLISINANLMNTPSPFMHYTKFGNEVIFLSYESLFHKKKVFSLNEILQN